MRIAAVVLLGAVLLIAPFASAQDSAEKEKMSIRDGQLCQGKNPFVLRGIRVSELIIQSQSNSDLATALSRIAEVGGNAVCFMLPGYDKQGALNPAAAKKVHNLMEQVIWRRMAGICRILPKNVLEDKEKCLAMVRAAATAMKNENRVVYWIDGPDVGGLVKAFREAAPGLVVAAATGGDIDVVDKLPGKAPRATTKKKVAAKPIMLAGGIPPAEKQESIHCVLTGNEQSYADLESAMKNPAESADWTPDNSVLSEQERKDGFVSLFDGKTLNGWWILGRNEKGFAVEDGSIVWKSEGGRGLYTRDRYDNFILRLEWKINKGGNSGLYLRAPRAGRQSKIGMEFQLQGDAGAPVTDQTTGAIYDVVPPKVNASKPAGEWNRVEIELNGGHMKAVLNGQLVQDTDLEKTDELRARLRKGFIGLQDHASFVAFRSIRVKKL